MRNAHPAEVTICGVVYQAVRYSDPFSPLHNTVWCVGKLPQPYAKNTHTCFNFGDGKDWYIACHYPDLKNKKQKEIDATEAHPFGANFLLMEWVHDMPIDTGKIKPYTRVDADISFPLES
jgi:hypothetical protein